VVLIFNKLSVKADHCQQKYDIEFNQFISSIIKVDAQKIFGDESKPD